MGNKQSFIWKEEYEQSYSQQLNMLQHFSLQLLNMPITEINQAIEREIENNPIVEYEELIQPTFAHDDLQHDMERASGQETFHDEFMKQLTLKNDDIDIELAELILMNLDTHGFLNREVLADFSKSGYSISKINQTLTMIKACVPYGLGCLDVQDFILFQLQNSHNRNELAIRIVRDFLEIFYFNRHDDSLLNLLHCDKGALDDAEQAILTCRPYPATLGDTNQYIVPDIEVTLAEELSITIREPMYRLKVASIASQYEYQDYAKSFIKQINRLNRAITMRTSTMNRIMQVIASKNEAFFLHHESLCPLTMQETADHLHIHKSTVSRAVQNKYVSVGNRTYPMRMFFLADSLHCGHNIQQIESLIKELIDREADPLRDETIAERLKTQGINISRRTVTKYRQRMGIDNYRIRRSKR